MPRQVFATFEAPIVDADGLLYAARACGRQRPGGEWEGWIEFVRADGGPTLRTRRETTQSTRGDLAHWAGGLTAVYLEGALARALAPMPVAAAGPIPPPEPAYGRPAPPWPLAGDPPAILDPFSVRQKGETRLRDELGALDAWHLLNIVRAYGLADERSLALEDLPARDLVELIVAATEGVRSARR